MVAGASNCNRGILLLNLGTPDSPKPKAVYCYLKQFLNDPRVIDLPMLARWVLTNLIIVPLRYKKSASAYQKIWTEQGSPLLVNSVKLATSLAATLGAEYQVELGMRYGNPSISSALAKLKNCDKLFILPLFPQYSVAATGSAIEAALQLLTKRWNIPEIFIKKDFYDYPGFIAAYAEVVKTAISDKDIDLFIFSYHGLPERHITKSACKSACDRLSACPSVTADNAFCYRAQCYETSRLLAESLGLTPQQYQVAFQSRLGRTPWIKPYTDILLPELKAKGIKNIAVVCPSFVADCLETLEEVNMQLRSQWLKLGGSDFIFVPCLNNHPAWVESLAQLIKKQS